MASTVPLKYLGLLYHLQLQISSAVWAAVGGRGSPLTRAYMWSIMPFEYRKHFRAWICEEKGLKWHYKLCTGMFM